MKNKLLCKKDYWVVDGVKCWTKDKSYSYEENYFFSKIETDLGPFTYEKHPIRIEDKIIMDYPNRIKECFYTPEESINIKRVKLIDDILNDN